MRNADSQGVCIAVGFFDGVHLGHQAILAGADTVLTFNNHPLSILAPESAPRLIMPPNDRIATIKACGISTVVSLDFTRELSVMPPEDFAAKYLKARCVRCGENWRFGKGGRGDADLLRRLGIEVVVVPYSAYNGERVSSTRIRAALEGGDVESANAMLGKEFEISGTAIRGKGLGSKIGYPTVNIAVDDLPGSERVRLPCGVYEVLVGGVRGIANYGVAPTMRERSWKSPMLEVHFLGGVPDISQYYVKFIRFIRPEREFKSLEELRRQIAADCAIMTA